MATLYYPDGRPIDFGKLKEEQAGPSVAGVRQIVSGHPAQGLTPGRLARILLDAESGDAENYLLLAEEMEEKDLHYLSVMGTRKRAISQLEMTVVAAGDEAEYQKHADFIKDFLTREEIEDEMFDILDAVGKGYSATEIMWDINERMWMPQRLEWRFPQWFEFDRNDGRTLHLRTEQGPQPLDPYKFIVHLHKAKSGLPIRGGLARAAAWGYLFKNYDLKDWITFIEVYGQPIRVGKFDAAATDKEKDILLQAVSQIGSDAAAIIPKSMMIEFIKSESSGGGTGTKIYEEFAEYIDKQISKAVLGQTLTTEVGDTGSYAAGRVHNDVREDIERADCKQVAATLNHQLVRPMIDLNFGPQKKYPCICIGAPEQTDIKALSDSLANVVPLGLRVKSSEVREKMGLSEPEDDDEVLSGSPAGSTPAADETDRRQARSYAVKHLVAIAAQSRKGRAPDAVDGLIDELVNSDQMGAAVEDYIGPIDKLAAASADYEDFKEKLIEAVAAIDVDKMADALARSQFAAALAGEEDADLGGG
ncbi:MAG: DUF935 domain-containing protein [Rhodospirillales bacterium]